MTSIAAKSLQSLRASRTYAGTARFLAWWKDELLGGLPPRWRAVVDHRAERLMAREKDGEVLLWRDNNGGVELGRFRIDDDPDGARQTVMAALGQIDEAKPPTVLVVPDRDVLCKTLNLPSAAEENLRQVLAFEMDRHTPFKADQVYFDCRIISRNQEHRNMQVELVVLMRKAVDPLLDLVRDRGLALDQLDVFRRKDGDAMALFGVNLLPVDKRAPRSNRQLKLNLFLGALFLILLYTVMWQSLVARERAIDDFRDRISAATAEAVQVTALRNELQEAREAAGFLSDKKADMPVVMDVLDEMTRLLPHDTWLQRLQVANGQVTLTGQSPEAAGLIGILQKSDQINYPAPKGAYTPDPQSGKERFTIEATINQQDTEDDGAAVTGQG